MFLSRGAYNVPRKGAVRMRAGRLNTKLYKTRRGVGWTLPMLLAGILALYGAFLWKSGAMPGSALFSPAPTLTPQESAPEQREWTLPEKTWYAVSLAVCEGRDAARQVSESLRARGAAGYLYASGETVHVLGAAFETRSDAQRVLTQLRAQHGIEGTALEIVRPRVTLRLHGQSAQLSALQDACDFLDQAADQLSALSQGLDKRLSSAADAENALSSLAETASSLSERLSFLFGESPHRAVAALQTMLKELARAAGAARGSKAIALGAQVKWCQLSCLCGMAAYADQLAE